MPRPSKRERLLAAAAAIVRRDGSDALTLDAVARESGVSKGGLLYHFGSKEALVQGLVEALLSSFEAQLGAAGEDAPGAFTRAYLGATAQPRKEESDVTAGLLAAVALAPHLLEPLRERYRAWARRFEEDGIDPIDALVVRLASDGLWMAELLGFEPPAAARRKQVVARLEALARAKPARRGAARGAR